MKISFKRIPWLVLNVLACGCWLAIPAWRARAASNHCLSSLRQAALANILYASDNEDTLPIAARWADLTFAYTQSPSNFACPALERKDSNAFGHAFSTPLSSAKVLDIRDQGGTALLFDSVKLGWNASGEFGDLPKGARRNAVFLDMRAKPIPP